MAQVVQGWCFKILVGSVGSDVTEIITQVISDIDYSISNIVVTSDSTVDAAQLAVSYGGSWQGIGTQTVGSKRYIILRESRMKQPTPSH